MDNQLQTTDFSLENMITAAVKIPGVKVSRSDFLESIFAKENVNIQDVVNLGPIEANVPRERLSYLANKLIIKRTSQSSIASFAAGIPGGLAMAATIPCRYITVLRYGTETGTGTLIPIWSTGSLERRRD